MAEIDRDTLAGFNGKEGKPAYIAYQGRVIDVSKSNLWKAGVHMKRHQAGNDLTAAIQAAPHGTEVLSRFPEVGILSKERIPERQLPEALSRLLKRYPILRRHPHPMVVHFPIVFMFSATIFTILYLLIGVESLEITGLHCLAGGILLTPVAILTGFFTWWLNYLAKPMRPVRIKIRFSLLLVGASLAAFIWRMVFPGVLDSLGVGSVLYVLLILSLIPLVTIVGWYGATLTFPIER